VETKSGRRRLRKKVKLTEKKKKGVKLLQPRPDGKKFSLQKRGRYLAEEGSRNGGGNKKTKLICFKTEQKKNPEGTVEVSVLRGSEKGLIYPT